MFSVPAAYGQTAGRTGDEKAASTPVSAPTATPTPELADSSTAKTKPTKDPAAKPKKQKRGSLIPAPIPITSPTLGYGMILGLGYVFQLKKSDTVSPPSVIGGAAAFTNSGSRGFAVGAHLYLAENKYQTTIAFGSGRANYDFYGVGLRPGQPSVSVRLRQGGTVFFAEFMRNVWKNIFIGPRYQYRKLTVSVDGQPTPGGFEIPPIDRDTVTASLGFHIERDQRDNSFYPTKGSLWKFTADFFGKGLGSSRDYQVYKASYNGYRSLGTKQVFAYRGSICSVSDLTPFFDLCLFGSSSDLRGYTVGQFQDHRMFAAQVEFRRELRWRIGVVGFAGIGAVARKWSELRFGDMLPAGGAGLRFQIDKKNHINYRIDWGYGRAGSTLTMSVTEAF